MASAEEIWRSKSDEQLLEAAENLAEYTEEGQRIIRVELGRRGLPEPSPMGLAESSTVRIKRPTPVTVICTLLLVTSFFGVVGGFFGQTEQASRNATISPAVQLLTSISALVSAAAMLKGLNWGRILYIVSSVGWMIYLSMTYRQFSGANIIGAGFWALVVYYLTRPDAAFYFAQRTGEPGAARSAGRPASSVPRNTRGHSPAVSQPFAVIEVKCWRCGNLLAINRERRRTTVKCPNCGTKQE